MIVGWLACTSVPPTPPEPTGDDDDTAPTSVPDLRPDCGFVDFQHPFDWRFTSVSTHALERRPDQSFLGSPDVDLDPATGGWRLVYAAQYGDGVGRIALATAPVDDPTTWTDGGVLLSPPEPLGAGFLDTPDLVDVGGEQRLYYFGAPASEQATGGRLAVATRTGREGAFTFPVDGPIVAFGEPADWDGNWVESPMVVVRDGQTSMWYGGADLSWKVGFGLATSSDGLTFATSSDNPVLLSTSVPEDDEFYLSGGPTVVRAPADDRFWLFYGCVSAADFAASPIAGLCLATSTDGVAWDRYPGNPLVPRSFFVELGDIVAGPLNPSAVIDGSDPARPRLLVFYEHAAAFVGLLEAPICRGM